MADVVHSRVRGLKAQLSMDPVLRLLVPIVEAMIAQLWQLMRRWATKKHEVIKAVREGLMKKKRKIEGDGFWIDVLYSKHVIDLAIYLNGGHGDSVEVPDLGIPKEVLRAMRLGWRASDASHNYGKPIMTTYFAWQVLSWLITMPNAEAWIYARGISVAKDGVKPMWDLQINGFEVEWSSDIDAYKEMASLPKELLPIAVLHAVLGDGHSMTDNGARKIMLYNDNRTVLETIKARLEREFKISSPISPDKGLWCYAITGPSAKNLAEASVKALEELAPTAKRLYDQMADGKYTMIWFEKWARIVKASRYVLNGSKILFLSITWSPNFRNGSIELKKITMDAEYAERIRREVEAQGIDVAITKSMRRDRNEVCYNVRIRWSVLKKHLCSNEELRNALIETAMKAIENCRIQNMTHPDKKKDCDSIPAAKWFQRLTDPQWLRKHLGCLDT